MMMMLKKTYTLVVTVQDNSDEFWEAIQKSGKTGCDEVMDAVREALYEKGLIFDDHQVSLMKFSQEPPIV